ncbi:MAG: N-acetylmuramoyl-L-alanine amidase [Elusimicrobiota bacterium]|jgi:N-acetylmuramoyl-L-alanine amidase|nr:N-acetylmuramoyl-L-alanine amidase [Elusimicrobiota bacterium]
MLKKILLTALGTALLSCGFAQQKTPVELFGKSKGSVKVLQENGDTYVEARPLSKLLKMRTSWFGRSGQLNIKNGDGYFCVLRRDLALAVVNGKDERLSAPVLMRGGDLYAPLSFFSQGSIAAAAGCDVSLADGKIIIKKSDGIAAPRAVITAAAPPESSAPDGAEDITDSFFTPPPAAAAAVAAPAAAKPLPKAVLKTLPPSVARMDNRPGKKTRKARILIDAGHGDKDPGAVRPGSSPEKSINLAVAKELYALLSKEKDFEVKMTRSNDTFITLGGRAKMANDFKADIFISLHSNAAKRPSADGFEVYFRSDKASSAEAAETAALENEALQYEGKSPTAVSFAELLLKSLANNENMNESSKIAGHIKRAVGKNSRAIGIKVHENSCIKQANFYVLRGVQAPAVLVEMGYMSNSNDKKRLNSKASRAKIAESLRDGLLSYAKAEGWR